MARGYFITHPDVTIDPEQPIERWALSARGRERMQALLSQTWELEQRWQAIDGVAL